MVARQQRFAKSNPCPICGGHPDMPRGHGERCHGFLSDNGQYAHCTREEHAGPLDMIPDSQTYAHKLVGDCRCGKPHAPHRSDQGIENETCKIPDEARNALIVIKIYLVLDKAILTCPILGVSAKCVLWARPSFDSPRGLKPS